MNLKALQSFSGPDGKHAKGDVFQAPAARAKFLLDGGYAAQADDADQALAAASAAETASPAAAPAAEPTSKRRK
ncbi:MAG: hypothetical protein EOO22_24975 [Comamonadaceae bacterium]|nr:MAG: hypothetical protein EOO22_24975 [Comamonadaceae bacterium]